MQLLFVIVFVRLVLLIVLLMKRRGESSGKGELIEWPSGIMGRVALEIPSATGDDLSMLKSGFESYLHAIAMFGADVSVAMPSRAVDEVWHNCILHSRFYEKLCAARVGWFIHHDPGPMPGARSALSKEQAERELDGLARAWLGSCDREGLDPFGESMPALFAADRLLGLADGFWYSSDDQASSKSLKEIQGRASVLLIEVEKKQGASWAPWRWSMRRSAPGQK